MSTRQLGSTAVLFVAFLAFCTPAAAQSRASIRYTVRFPAPQTNYLDVEAVVPTDGRPSIEMFMAVWTPRVVPDSRVRAQRRGGGRRRRRAYARGRETRQE